MPTKTTFCKYCCRTCKEDVIFTLDGHLTHHKKLVKCPKCNTKTAKRILVIPQTIQTDEEREETEYKANKRRVLGLGLGNTPTGGAC